MFKKIQKKSGVYPEIISKKISLFFVIQLCSHKNREIFVLHKIMSIKCEKQRIRAKIEKI